MQGAWRGALCVLVALAAGVPAGWIVLILWPQAGTVALGAAAAVAACAGLLTNALAPDGGGLLHWDGRAWRWHADGAPAAGSPGAVHLVLDLGAWILLRFDAADGRPARRWLALAARRDPQRWPQLRALLWTWRPAR